MWSRAQCAAMGIEGIDYFTLDPNWIRGDCDWDEAKSIADHCRTVNMPFGMIYWASLHAVNGTDKNWYDDIMEQGKDCLDANVNPDRYWVHNWIDSPAKILPEDEEWSFTKSVLDFYNNYTESPTPTPTPTPEPANVLDWTIYK